MRIDLHPPLDRAGALATALGAALTGDARTRIAGLATHSQEVRRGDVFVALKGEHADGAAYISDALAKGAVGVLSALDVPLCDTRALLFAAPDPVSALLSAAAAYRRVNASFLVAVSGSVGKTTAKEGIAELLRGKGSVSASIGNYNSEIGLPLSLLSFPKSDFSVVELGINHVGEMARMASTAAPDLAVLTNVGTAHVGQFGDFPTLLAEKAKLASSLGENGRLLAPAELPRRLFACKNEQIFTFGTPRRADFYLENVESDEKGVRGDLIAPDRVITNLNWPISGRVGADALLTVASAALLCGCDEEMLRLGLRRAALKTPRMQMQAAGKRLLMDDTYNASPEAVLNAVEVLRYRAPGRPLVAVLGDMLELGRHSEGLHRAVGAGAVKNGISMIFAYGDFARYYAEGARGAGLSRDRIFLFDKSEREELLRAVCKQTPMDAALLIKGSGKLKMGELARAIGEYDA